MRADAGGEGTALRAGAKLLDVRKWALKGKAVVREGAGTASGRRRCWPRGMCQWLAVAGSGTTEPLEEVKGAGVGGGAHRQVCAQHQGSE